MSNNSQKPERSKKIRKSVSKSKQVKKTEELRQGLGGFTGEIPGLPKLGELGIGVGLPGLAVPGLLAGSMDDLLKQHQSVLDEIKKLQE